MVPIIIYRLGSLGDTVVALPCFHKIAEAYPRSRRLVLTNFPVSSKAAPLAMVLDGSGLIDGVIQYPVQLRSPKAVWHLYRQLRDTGSDTLIYLAANRGKLKLWRDLLFFRLCGFKNIIGAPLRSDLRGDRIDPTDATLEREAERLARSLHELGPIDLGASEAWDLHLTPAEIETARKAIAVFRHERFFALNMGGKVAANDWGEDNWFALIERLAVEYPALHLVVVGAAEDASRAERVLNRWPAKGVSVCGALTPRESAALLKEAHFFLGHDSGPLHLAAAMQTSCIGLFGNNNPPKKWHPYGNQHHVLHDMRGVRAIEVGTVQSAVQRLMQDKTND
jgi:heptosyltransferase-3